MLNDYTKHILLCQVVFTKILNFFVLCCLTLLNLLCYDV
nr:MAG TPA: hypothetical protein [Caudoviricetes sp.]